MSRDEPQGSNGNGRLYALVIVLALGGGAGGDALLGRLGAQKAEAVSLGELQRLESHLDRRVDQARAAADAAATAARAELAEQIAALRRQAERERELLARELQAMVTMRTPAGLEERLGAIERWIVRTDPTWGAHLNDPSVARWFRAELGGGRPRDSP